MSDTKAELYGQFQNGISLQEAVDKAHPLELLAGAIGLFYSPRECAVGRLNENGSITTLRQKKSKWAVDTFDLASVFEAQLFTTHGELRWLNEQDSEGGRAVLITESAVETAIFSETIEENIVAYDVIEQRYLVWGRYDDHTKQVPEDWTILSTSQIGRLAVPLTQKSRQDFAVLSTREYLATDDNGNAYVKYERLLNLSWEAEEK